MGGPRGLAWLVFIVSLMSSRMTWKTGLSELGRPAHCGRHYFPRQETQSYVKKRILLGPGTHTHSFIHPPLTHTHSFIHRSHTHIHSFIHSLLTHAQFIHSSLTHTFIHSFSAHTCIFIYSSLTHAHSFIHRSHAHIHSSLTHAHIHSSLSAPDGR